MIDNPLRSELNNLERKLILLLNEHNKLKRDLSAVQKENLQLKDLI